MFRMRLFGRPSLVVGEERRAWPAARRAAELLAWLALHPGAHARGELAPRFWPDVLDESARASLRTALRGLRSELGEEGAGVLVVSRGAVALSDDVWVDVREFERALRDGRDADAVGLATGELLRGLDAEWAWAARDRATEDLVAALGRLAARRADVGDLAAAVEHARRRAALDPLSEDAARQLMRVLAAAGDRAAALAAYDAFTAHLARTLRTAPSAATRALAAELGEPAAPPARPAAAPPRALAPPPALLRADRAPLVGRDAEIARVRGALQRCADGRGGLLLVEGPAGVGKSRLARETARAARERGVAAMLGRCHADPVAPYHLFADALGRVAAAGGADALARSAGVLAGELARLVPRLGEYVEDLPPATEAVSDDARHRLYEAVTAVAGGRPEGLLLVAEDVHWADADSLRLLEHVVRGTAGAPVLVLATTRPAAPVAAMAAALAREDLSQVVRVGDLDRDASDELIAAWLGERPDRAAGDALYARTAGNPFFLEEALRERLEDGGEAQSRVPRTVAQVIRQRIARLGPATQAALAAGAVAGRRFALGTVEAIAGAEALDGLERAVGAHLLVEDPERADGFAFAHALVRDAVLEDLSRARRARLHLRVAELLEAAGGDRRARAAEIAHHRLQSGRAEDVARAGELLREAADLARDALSHERAAALYAQALATGAAAGEDRVRLLVELGWARARAGDGAAGREAFREAARDARAVGDGRLLAEAALGLGGLGVTILDVDPESVALLDDALARLPPADRQLRARCLARLAIELYYTPTRDRSLALSAEALELAGDEDAVTTLHALNARHVALWTPDHPRERLAVAERMIALARDAAQPELELQGRNWRIADLLELGRLDEQDRELDAHEHLVQELRLASYRWWVPTWRAGRAALRGDFAEARRLAAQARELAHPDDRNAARARRQTAIALALVEGRFADVDTDGMERLVADSPATVAWRTALAWILAERGEPEAADAHLAALEREGFPAPKDANWYSAVIEAAEACAVVGRAGLARQLYPMLEPYAGCVAVSGRAIHCFGSTDRALGRLADVLGLTDRADRHFADAAALEGRLGARPWLVRTYAHHAETLERRGAPGDPARAAELRSLADGLRGEMRAPESPG